MLRVFLIYVVPLVVPAILYILWRLWQLKRGSGDMGLDVRTVVRGAPWLLLIGIGTGLLLLVLVIAALTGGEPPHESYQPPHIENGHVVPGETHPDGGAPL